MTITRIARTLAAAALLCIVPVQAASAGTGGGGGSADYTITTAKFTALSCHLYSQRTWPSGQVQRMYACSGGVRYTGGAYYGVACAQHWGSWGWFAKPCSQV